MEKFSEAELAEIARRQIAFDSELDVPGDLQSSEERSHILHELAQELNAGRLKRNGGR